MLLIDKSRATTPPAKHCSTNTGVRHVFEHSTRASFLFRYGLSVTPVLGDEREEAVRSDREKVEAEGFWRYNDIPGAFEEAERTGKPIVVVLRCLPCEECVKLDDELVDTDPVIRPLLEKFVCVRQVATNGLDLDLFQYDTDQSFAMFFLAADKTIYGRFGTRSHRTEWYGDVSLKGLAKALQRVLEMHEQHDEIKASLAGKSGKPPRIHFSRKNTQRSRTSSPIG